MRFNFQLNKWTTILFILLTIVGLRDKFDLLDRSLNLPPHFMQFNMYVWALKSPSNPQSDPEQENADFYVPLIDKTFNSIQLFEIKPTLGALITSDRWRGDKKTINRFFCEIKDEIGIDKQYSFEVVASYIKNKREIVSIDYDIKCI